MAKSTKGNKRYNKSTEEQTYEKGKSNSNRNNNKGKSFQRNSKRSNKMAERGKGVVPNSFAGSENDPTWYNRNKTLLDDVARISFYNQAGRTYNLNADEEDTGFNLEVPTIMAFNMVCTPGYSPDSVSGLSLATQGVYAVMRRKLSTVATYAAADVGMYVLALDQIYSFWAYIMRLFGVVNLYSSRNLAYPKGLLKAITNWSDESIDDFRNNVNHYRSIFNKLIYKASALYLPTDFSITARHAWLYGSVFTDSRNVKAQLYVHTPVAMYFLNETKYDTGTALEHVFRATKMFDSVDPHHPAGSQAISDGMYGTLAAFNEMIERIRNSDSMLNIQSDMERAFEGKDFWQLTLCDEGFMIEPTHSDEVLSQINNLVPVGWWGAAAYHTAAADSRDVTQSVDKNTIIFDPFALPADLRTHYGDAADAWFRLILDSKRALNFHWDSPTPDDIAVATRDTVSYSLSMYPLNQPSYHLTGMGADICTTIDFYVQNKNEITKYSFEDMNKEGSLPMLSKLMSFDWAPTYYAPSGNTEDNSEYACAQDFDNFVLVHSSVLEGIHTNIMMNMWNIPELGMIGG